MTDELIRIRKEIEGYREVAERYKKNYLMKASESLRFRHLDDALRRMQDAERMDERIYCYGEVLRLIEEELGGEE